MKIMISTRLFGLVSALLLAAGALVLWTVSSNTRAAATAPPPAPLAASAVEDAPALQAIPAASAKSREEQRFSRADRDDDGLISQSEYLSTRRRNYEKLDSDGDGRLSFEEYAVSGIEKFTGADSDSNGALVPTEFAKTAPKPRKPTQTAANCACISEQGVASAS